MGLRQDPVFAVCRDGSVPSDLHSHGFGQHGRGVDQQDGGPVPGSAAANLSGHAVFPGVWFWKYSTQRHDHTAAPIFPSDRCSGAADVPGVPDQTDRITSFSIIRFFGYLILKSAINACLPAF